MPAPQETQDDSFFTAAPDPVPTEASENEPILSRASYRYNQLIRSISDSSIVKHGLLSVYERPSQAQSTTTVQKSTLSVPNIPTTAPALNQKASHSSPNLFNLDLETKDVEADESEKHESLNSGTSDKEEATSVETKPEPATNRRGDAGNQHGDRTTREGETSSRPAGFTSSGAQQFSNSAPNLALQRSSASSSTPQSPVPRIRLHHSDVDRNWIDEADIVAPSSGRSTPSIDSGSSTPGEREDESFFGSSSLLEAGSDYDDADSQDDSLALVPTNSPSSSTPHRRSLSTELIRTPSPGGLNVIWIWVSSKRRNECIQTFFWITRLLCRPLTQKDIPMGYVYAFRVKDPQGRDYIKIGFTTRFKSRMKAHFDCYGDLELIYPPTGETPALVKHARRVEQLIHAELVNQAISLEQCPRARQKHSCHTEWFNVTPRHATDVIRKWSDWMSGSPYEERAISSTQMKRRKSADGAIKTVWNLGVLQQDMASRLCWPVAMTDDDGDDGIIELGKEVRLLTFD